MTKQGDSCPQIRIPNFGSISTNQFLQSFFIQYKTYSKKRQIRYIINWFYIDCHIGMTFLEPIEYIHAVTVIKKDIIKKHVLLLSLFLIPLIITPFVVYV